MIIHLLSTQFFVTVLRFVLFHNGNSFHGDGYVHAQVLKSKQNLLLDRLTNNVKIYQK